MSDLIAAGAFVALVLFVGWWEDRRRKKKNLANQKSLFEIHCAHQAGWTLDELHLHYTTIRCKCGMRDCWSWQLVPA